MALSADVEHRQGAGIRRGESIETVQKGLVCTHRAKLGGYFLIFKFATRFFFS